MVRTARQIAIFAVLSHLLLLAATNCRVRAQNSSEQEELIKAQTEYYRAQTDKLTARPGFWQSLKDNPASAIGVLGAVVALVSFIFNYRVTLRTQRDTQFYEALKRFGDKDSPTVRASAAGLIAQMGQTKTPVLGKHPYFKTALSQLMTGLALEQNYVALLSIRDGLLELINLDLSLPLKHLYESNLKLQEDACVFLAKFCVVTDVTRDVAGPGDIAEDTWRKAMSVTLHDRYALTFLAENHKEIFSPFFESYKLAFLGMSDAQRIESLIAAQQNLQIAFNRLDVNVELCSRALKLLDKDISDKYVGTTFEHIFLAKADLSEVHLRNVTMREAQLQQANLSESTWENVDMRDVQLQGANLAKSNWKNSDLRGARLQNTKIRWAYLGDAKFKGANWWAANFYDEEDSVNSDFLEAFYYLYRLPTDDQVKDVHESTKEFVAEKMNLLQRDSSLGWPLKGL